MQEVLIHQVMTPWAFWIASHQTIGLAHDMMKKYGIRHLPIQDESNKVIGLLYERDVLFAKAWAKDSSSDMSVTDVCLPEPYQVDPKTPLTEVLKYMVKERCDCTLIVDQGKLCGIFTATDACKTLHDMIGAPEEVPMEKASN
jgi:acetoin utilization protein AcuB